jgi:hypothetical protein
MRKMDIGKARHMAVRPRIGGVRVVMSWPDSRYAPQPPPRGRAKVRLAGAAGTALIFGGLLTILVAVLAQQHAPAPPASAAGTTGPARAQALSVRQSVPVSVAIPAIGVRSRLLHLGRNKDGTMAVPNLLTSAKEAAWYKYSVTPGQVGTSVIEGHVDNYRGPAVFFRLGAVRPGDLVNVKLADGMTAIFRVTGVRQYVKADYPASAVYAPARYAALRIITCGGAFDRATGHYLSSVVVYASLVGHSPA